MVRGDQEEVLEIRGKTDQNGHRMPIRMSKTTGFPGRTHLDEKGGGGGGGQKCKISRKTQLNMVRSGRLGRILVQIERVCAHLSAVSIGIKRVRAQIGQRGRIELGSRSTFPATGGRRYSVHSSACTFSGRFSRDLPTRGKARPVTAEPHRSPTRGCRPGVGSRERES